MSRISPRILSEDEIMQDLHDIVAGQPDSDKWLDWFDASHGRTIMEWLTAVSSYLSYQAIAYRREANPVFGRLKSTIYASAALFGYPINRRAAAILELEVLNDDEPFFLDKFDPLGDFSGTPVSLMESTHIVRGRNVIRVIVGTWKTHTHIVKAREDNFEFEIPLDVDMDYICNDHLTVTINDKPQKTSRFIEDLQENKVIVRTYIDTLCLMFGSISAGYVVQKGDKIDVEYVELNPTSYDPTTAIYDTSTFSSQLVSLQGLTIIRRETLPDSLQKISRLLPGYFASKRNMVTPEDHTAIVTGYQGIISAAYATGVCSTNPLFLADKKTCEANDGEWMEAAKGKCCTEVVSYLRDDLTPMLDTEEDELYNYLKTNHMIAGNYVQFVAGIPVTVKPKVAVLVEQDFNDTDNLSNYIFKVLKDQCYQLGSTFQVGKFIFDINNIKGVLHSTIIRPRKDLRLSWQGYFNPGSIDLFITKRMEDILEFGGEEGGYLPYTDTAKGVIFKARASKNVYRLGDTIEITGYIFEEGNPITGLVINIEMGSKKEKVITKTDGTFSYTYELKTQDDLKLTTAKVTTTVDKEYTEVIKFAVTSNVYEFTSTYSGSPIVGKPVTVSFVLRKNSVRYPYQKVQVTPDNIMVTTDKDGNGTFIHTIKDLKDFGVTLTYIDPYGTKADHEVSWSPALPDSFKVSIELADKNKTTYLVGEVVRLIVTLTNNDVPEKGHGVIIRPEYKGVIDNDSGRTVVTGDDGKVEVVHLASNSDVDKGITKLVAQVYSGLSVAASSSVALTISLNPNGSPNGLG